MENLKDFVTYLEDGNMVEDIECNMERYKNEVYLDQDFYDFFELLGATTFDIGDSTMVITSVSIVIAVPYVEVENKHDVDLPKEMLFDFDKMKVLSR